MKSKRILLFVIIFLLISGSVLASTGVLSTDSAGNVLFDNGFFSGSGTATDSQGNVLRTRLGFVSTLITAANNIFRPEQWPEPADAASSVGSTHIWVALPFENSEYATAADLKRAIEASTKVAVHAIQQWDGRSENYLTYSAFPLEHGNFPLSTGGVYKVVTSAAPQDFTWGANGDLPSANTMVNELIDTGQGTPNWLTLPLDQENLSRASQLATALELQGNATVLSVSKWDALQQSYVTYTDANTDFDLRVGDPYRVVIDITDGSQLSWPTR